MKLIGRISAVVGAATVALVLSAAPALAHVTANPGEATAGSYSYHAFRVGHGCDGSPTTRVTVHIPEGVTSVKPQELAGWKIDIAEGVEEVSWTAATPLPDNQMQQFGLSMKMPDKAGETVYFPVVQTCQKGATRWIEIPAQGRDEPEHPAAAVMLSKAAAGDAHGDGHGDTAETEETAAPADEAATDQPVAQAGQLKNDDSNTLAVIALLVGIAGLLTGGAALARGRR